MTRGNTYMLCFTDNCSPRPDILAVKAATFTAEGPANSVMDRYISSGIFMRNIVLDHGLQVCSKLSHASISFSVFGKFPPTTPITLTATVGWNM